MVVGFSPDPPLYFGEEMPSSAIKLSSWTLVDISIKLCVGFDLSGCQTELPNGACSFSVLFGVLSCLIL